MYRRSLLPLGKIERLDLFAQEIGARAHRGEGDEAPGAAPELMEDAYPS